jgi:hypothetical protein
LTPCHTLKISQAHRKAEKGRREQVEGENTYTVLTSGFVGKGLTIQIEGKEH